MSTSWEEVIWVAAVGNPLRRFLRSARVPMDEGKTGYSWYKLVPTKIRLNSHREFGYEKQDFSPEL